MDKFITFSSIQIILFFNNLPILLYSRHSKNMLWESQEAAPMLKENESICTLAKINAEENPVLSERLSIDYYPVIKFYQ